MIRHCMRCNYTLDENGRCKCASAVEMKVMIELPLRGAKVELLKLSDEEVAEHDRWAYDYFEEGAIYIDGGEPLEFTDEFREKMGRELYDAEADIVYSESFQMYPDATRKEVDAMQESYENGWVYIPSVKGLCLACYSPLETDDEVMCKDCSGKANIMVRRNV